MNEDKEHPGLSGKNKSGEKWVNLKKLQDQHETADDVYDSEKGFAAQGRGANLFGRTDLTNQEQSNSPHNEQEVRVIEALRRSPEVDLKGIEVKVNNGVVTLSGEVNGPTIFRTFENIVKNLPGIERVINQLHYGGEDER